MTREEAIAKVATKWWMLLPAERVVAFQLFEDRLCMDFGDFHLAVEQALGHPVWTHQFACPDALKAEFRAKYPDLAPVA